MALTGKLEADFSSFFDACKQAVASLAEVNSAGSGLASSMDELTGTVGEVALGFLGAQSAAAVLEHGVEFLTESFSTFEDAELNVHRLTASLQESGAAADDVTAQYLQLGEQFAATTIYSQDMVTEAERMFTLIGQVGPDEMGAALTAATNLASGLGVDLETAVRMVAKAAEGNVTALHRYGIEIDAAAVKAGGASVAFDAINQRFGGQAQADMDTTAGKMSQLSHEFEEFEKAVGSSIANSETFNELLGLAKTALDHQIESMQNAKKEETDQITLVENMNTSWRNYFNTLLSFDPLKFASEMKGAIGQIQAMGTPGGGVPAMPAAPAQFQMPSTVGPSIKDATDAMNAFTIKLMDAQHEYANFKTQADPGPMKELTAAFQLGTVSTKELTAATGLSSDALKIAKKDFEDHAASIKKATTEAEKHAQVLKDVAAAYVPLTVAQMQTAVANDSVGLSAETTAKQLGISAAAVKSYLAGLAESAKEADAWQKVHDKMADATHKFTEKATEDLTKYYDKQADISTKTLGTTLIAYQNYSDKVAQIDMSSSQIQIDNIQKQQAAAIAALGARTDANATFYDQDTALIETYYQHQIDLANNTADTIEERMAKQGVYTQDQLADMAFNADLAYQQMVASGNYTASELEAAAKKASDAWKKADDDTSLSWSQTMKSIETGLSELGNAFNSLGTSVGGTFGKMASEAGKAFSDMSGGLKDVMTGLASGNLIGEISGITAGLIKMGAAAVNGVKSLLGLGSAGRDAVVQFADSMGGFDVLHEKLDAIGASG
jgi:predicted transcriptional regulator